MAERNLVFRTDANACMGSGHVMRCLALAQAWQDTGRKAIFVMGEKNPRVEHRLLSEGMECVHLCSSPRSREDAAETAHFCIVKNSEWLVVDGYQFGTAYQRTVKETGLRLMVADDFGHAEYYCADFILNQNIHAHESLYTKKEPYTRLLLGVRYALLRREFLKWAGWQRTIKTTASRILVTTGGGDPGTLTNRIMEAVNNIGIPGLEVRVVRGPSNPRVGIREETASLNSSFTTILDHVADMAQHMSWADVAVSAAGSTCWELAYMGLPAIVVVLADNQFSVAQCLDSAGVVCNLGWHEDLSCASIEKILEELLHDPGNRARMSRQGRKTVDGRGAMRVVSFLDDHQIRLRPVSDSDCCFLWELANDSQVRSASFSPEPICWSDHVGWFRSKINDPSCMFYIGLSKDGSAIGYVRFDHERSDVVISVGLIEEFRGNGMGCEFIRLASERFFAVSVADRIHAYVKKGNTASVQAFTKAGFLEIETTHMKGYRSHHFILLRNENP